MISFKKVYQERKVIMSNAQQMELLQFSSVADNIISIKQTRNRSTNSKKKKVNPINFGLKNPGMNFKTFFTSEAHQHTLSIIDKVVEAPGVDYPFIYLCGASGTGKTHLLNAIAEKILHHNKKYRLKFMSGKELLENYKLYISQNRFAEFIYDYTDNVDGLFIDDIQEVFNSQDFQSDFCLIFSRFQHLKGQIICTGCTLPRDLKGLVARFSSRLSSGLVVQMNMVDKLVCKKIIDQRFCESAIVAAPSITDLMATRYSSNLHELESAILKIKSLDTFKKGTSITLNQAKSALNIVGATPLDKGSIQNTLSQVADHYKVSVESLLSNSRLKKIAIPRHMCMYILHHCLHIRPTKIASIFSKDHTSVLYALEKIKKLNSVDNSITETIQNILSSN
ncbi:MAG: ATP-binding protein [Bacteriovoracaceae bacterium]|nr:ATP-binding protein [Bacteriovoracaceae bacterium]